MQFEGVTGSFSTFTVVSVLANAGVINDLLTSSATETQFNADDPRVPARVFTIAATWSNSYIKDQRTTLTCHHPTFGASYLLTNAREAGRL